MLLRRSFTLLVVIIILSCNSTATKKQQHDKAAAAYQFPVPEKWITEKFPLPPSFAPSIAFKGVEDIRFAPGWANPANEAYWSYAFVWWMDGERAVSDTLLAASLQAYYTGLVASNAKSNTVLSGQKLIPAVAVIKKVAAADGDSETFQGDITMQDYMDLGLKQLVLHATIHKKQCSGHTALVFLLSPKEVSHPVWSSLNKLHTAFSCGQ